MGYARQLELGYSLAHCYVCSKAIPESEFYTAGKYKMSCCKECAKKKTREHYAKYRVSILKKCKRNRWSTAEKVFNEYRSEAKRAGREFSVELELFKDLITDNCFYCGAPPSRWNGVDRVDTAKGYFFGNVVSCCRHCNRAKMARPREEFEGWIVRAAQHIQKFRKL